MYYNEQTGTMVNEKAAVPQYKIVKTVGVKPKGEIISEQPIEIRKDDGTKVRSVLYVAKILKGD